jgi:hypothetical protein
MTVSREESRFQFSPVRDAVAIRYLPGLVFAPTALVTGRAEVGVLRYAPKDPLVRPFTGPVGTVDLGYVLLGVTRFGAQFSRDVVPSIDQLQTYFVQTAISGSVTHRISERWDAVASASRQRLAYHSLLTPAAPEAPGARLDFVSTYGGGIGFYFNRGLRLGTRVERVARDSPTPANRYDNFRVMGSFTYGFR